MELKFVSYNSKGQGDYQSKFFTQVHCTQFQLSGDFCPGFRINWLPLSRTLLSVLFLVAAPCSPLSYFSSRLWEGCCFLCLWTMHIIRDERTVGGSQIPIDQYIQHHISHTIFICCLHAIYPNSFWRVGAISHISYMSPNPAPLTWFFGRGKHPERIVRINENHSLYTYSCFFF